MSYSTNLTPGLLAPVSGARVDRQGVTDGARKADDRPNDLNVSVCSWP